MKGEERGARKEERKMMVLLRFTGILIAFLSCLDTCGAGEQGRYVSGFTPGLNPPVSACIRM